LFDNPDREERILYAKYWQKKLADNRNISFPDTLVWTVADATDKFSFAYLKEALYVAILVFSKISLMLQSFPPLQRLNARHTRKH
jgi:transitional endoplasmic reticulum ATPase